MKRARSLLAGVESLSGERDAAKLASLVALLDGCCGSEELENARDAVAAFQELEGGGAGRDVAHLLGICGHLTGSEVIESAGAALRAEKLLDTETNVMELRVLLAAAEKWWNDSDSVNSARRRLEAVECLRGEMDARLLEAGVERCAPLREGDDALEWAAGALVALKELAGVKDVPTARGIVGQLASLCGSQVLDTARRVLSAEDDIMMWIPFTIVGSLAGKLGKALAGERGSGGGGLMERILELFREFDQDGSGSITREEFIESFERMGINLTAAEVDCVMRAADPDGSGSVDQGEFADAIDLVLRRADGPLGIKEEVAQLTSLVAHLEGWTGSGAVEMVEFKLQLANLPEKTDRTWLENFFGRHSAVLHEMGYVTGLVKSRQQWVESASALDNLLSASSRKNPAVEFDGSGLAQVPKKELWLLCKGCGEMTGCVSLERARRVQEAEKKLGAAEEREEIKALLRIAGCLSGSPAVQRAEMLLAAEQEVAEMMKRPEGCTSHELQTCIRRCRPLRCSDTLDTARVVLLAELCLMDETRSHVLRRLLALCPPIIMSKEKDAAISKTAAEDVMSEPDEDSCDAPPTFAVAKPPHCDDAVFEMMCERASLVPVPPRKLLKSVVDVDVLRHLIVQCDDLTDCPPIISARRIIECLEALPRTLQSVHERDITRCLAVVGRKHLSCTEWGMGKVRERLTSVFEAVDEDGGGSVSMEEADKLFFALGVNLTDDEIMAITKRFDADGSGEMEVDEFCDMVMTMMNDDGGWFAPGSDGSLSSQYIRSLLSECGHILDGEDSQWVSNAWLWVRAEDALLEGVDDLEELTRLEDACAALTDSAVLEETRRVLEAAAEIEFATGSARIRQLLSVCGYLTNALDIREKESWVSCDDGIIALGYGGGWNQWRPSSKDELRELVDGCGGLEESDALVEARQALAAADEIAAAAEVGHLKRLMKMCGHLTGDDMIERARKWLRSESKLKCATDINEVVGLVRDARGLQGSSVLHYTRQALRAEARSASVRNEGELRALLKTIGGCITGSRGFLLASRRYAKYSEAAAARHSIRAHTDEASLRSALMVNCMSALFNVTDTHGMCELTAAEVRKALRTINIPLGDGRVAAKLLYGPFADLRQEEVAAGFCEVFFSLEDEDDASQQPTWRILQGLHSVGARADAQGVEGVARVLERGGVPGGQGVGVLGALLGAAGKGGEGHTEKIFFDSFLAFCRERFRQVGVSESGLCELFPQILADENVGRASRWVAAVDRLESERMLESLQARIEECGQITGSAVLDKARAIADAAVRVPAERDADRLKALLVVCGHLTSPPFILEAIAVTDLYSRLPTTTRLPAIRGILYGCRRIEGEHLTRARALSALHDSLPSHLLAGRGSIAVRALERLERDVVDSPIIDVSKALVAFWGMCASRGSLGQLAGIIAGEEAANLPEPTQESIELLRSFMIERGEVDAGLAPQDNMRCDVHVEAWLIDELKKQQQLSEGMEAKHEVLEGWGMVRGVLHDLLFRRGRRKEDATVGSGAENDGGKVSVASVFLAAVKQHKEQEEGVVAHGNRGMAGKTSDYAAVLRGNGKVKDGDAGRDMGDAVGDAAESQGETTKLVLDDGEVMYVRKRETVLDGEEVVQAAMGTGLEVAAVLVSWRARLGDFLEGAAPRCDPFLVSRYLALCVYAMRWTRVCELVTNLFYIRQRLSTRGSQNLISELEPLIEKAEGCGWAPVWVLTNMKATLSFLQHRAQTVGQGSLLLFLIEKGEEEGVASGEGEVPEWRKVMRKAVGEIMEDAKGRVQHSEVLESRMKNMPISQEYLTQASIDSAILLRNISRLRCACMIGLEAALDKQWAVRVRSVIDAYESVTSRLRSRIPLGDPVNRAIAWDAVSRTHPSQQQDGVEVWESGGSFLALADALVPSYPEGGSLKAVVALKIQPGRTHAEIQRLVSKVIGAGEEGKRRLAVEKVRHHLHASKHDFG